MNLSPDQPREKSTQMNLAALQYSEAFPDYGEIPFVEVTKRSRQISPRNLSSDKFSNVTSLLNRNLRDTRQWFAVLLQRCRVADDEDFGVILHGQVRLNSHPASAVRLCFQPLSCRRWGDPSGPDDCLARDTLAADYDALAVD
jgi:hypothetical protein